MQPLHNSDKNNLIIHHIINKVESAIRDFNMFHTGESVLIGVSGGPDSMALLHILNELSPIFSIQLGVAHLNHGLRKEDAETDATFVTSVCHKLGLPFFLEKKNVYEYQKNEKLSLEDAGRRIRYRFLYRIANDHRYDKIATGHHEDDNAELILMDIFRGCGPKGLSGIPPVRDNRIIRPLIRINRTEIETYLEKRDIPFRSDTSNWDTRFVRNRIRHELIPLITSTYNPNIVETLNRLTEIVRCEESWIEDFIEPIFNRICLNGNGNNQTVLSVSDLKLQHIAAARRIIRLAILKTKGDLKRISLSHIESIIHLLKRKSSFGNIDLPDRLRVSLKENQLIFCKEKTSLRSLPVDIYKIEKRYFSYQLPAPGILFIPEINGHLKFSTVPPHFRPHPFPPGQRTVFFDMDKLDFPLTVRNIQSGDRFSPLGMIGSQKVSTYFINQKVPKSQRVKYPIVIDKNGRVIWVVNHRIDNAVRIQASTMNLLKGELLLA